jgi:hypothetical protein
MDESNLERSGIRRNLLGVSIHQPLFFASIRVLAEECWSFSLEALMLLVLLRWFKEFFILGCPREPMLRKRILAAH